MPLPWGLRLLSLCGAGVIAGLLFTAYRLEPSICGYGTHQQLGLPPCTSLLLFNATCPACGMTTAWAWLARGELAHGLQANIGGCLLALIALAYLPLSCYFFCGGSRSPRGRWSLLFGSSTLVALATALLQWICR